MITDKPVYLTAEGKAQLEDELNNLKSVRRPEVADRIQQSVQSPMPRKIGCRSEFGFKENGISLTKDLRGRAKTIQNALDPSARRLVRMGVTTVEEVLSVTTAKEVARAAEQASPAETTAEIEAASRRS